MLHFFADLLYLSTFAAALFFSGVLIAVSLIHLIVVVCSLHSCFSFYLVFCWVILVKQLTLWITMLELSNLSFHQFLVSLTCYLRQSRRSIHCFQNGTNFCSYRIFVFLMYFMGSLILSVMPGFLSLPRHFGTIFLLSS